MPFDDVISLDLRFTEADLDKLDKLAEKAENSLNKIQTVKAKASKQAVGIYGGQRSGKALPKSTQAQMDRSKLERDSSATGPAVITSNRIKGQVGTQGSPIKRKNLSDEVKEQKNLLNNLLKSDMGAAQASKAISFLRDPLGSVTNFLSKEVPIIGGIIQVVDIANAVIDKLTEAGGFLDVTFRDTITTRLDAFRDKMTQSSIRSGFTQLIITTKAGTTNPRDTYNSYQQYNQNRIQEEDTFAVRNTRNY